MTVPNPRIGVFWKCAYVLAACWIMMMWIWSAESTTSFEGDPRCGLTELLNGTAHNPFAQRALVPLAVKGLKSAIPSGIMGDIKNWLLAQPKFQRESGLRGWNTDELEGYLLALVLSGLSLCAFPFMMRRLAILCYGSQNVAVDAIPIVGLAALPPFFFGGTHYIYDMPALFFFTAGLVLITEARWVWFYPVYAMGCMNKETMIMLAVAFASAQIGQRSDWRWLKHLVAMAAISLSVKLWMMLMFAGNPGTIAEFHLWRNLDELLHPYDFTRFVAIAVLGLCVAYGWYTKPLVLRRYAVIVIPFFGVTMVYGYVEEIRALYELVPVVVLLGAHTIFTLLRGGIFPIRGPLSNA